MVSAARNATLLLAVLAMVFRGLLPAGWMPNPQGFSETALILCDMDVPMSPQDMAQMMANSPDMSSMDMSGAPSERAPVKGHGSAECPFAAGTHAGATISAAGFMLLGPIVEQAQPAVQERSARRFVGYKPQFPRAPPSSSI